MKFAKEQKNILNRESIGYIEIVFEELVKLQIREILAKVLIFLFDTKDKVLSFFRALISF